MATRESSTSSVSKGCFVIRPSKAGSSRKRKSLVRSVVGFPCEAGESSEHARMRHKIYEETWSKVQEHVSSLQTNVNEKVFGDLLNFIKNSNFSNKPIGMKNEIPTGVFITGVNMPDHDAIFSQLHDKLLDETPYVARLCSKSCQNMKSIVKEAISEIMGKQYTLSEDVESKLEKFNKRKGNVTFSMFKQWYELMEKGDKKSPVVFVLEDFESFHAKTLQDFVTVCSLYVDQLPIVLLFGVATIPAVVHQLLPRSISSCLRIEKFHAQPAIIHLLEVIDRIFISSELSFKLGPKVFQYLYENFLFHDFSLQNFIFGLKFCMMDHFYGNPLSVLCSKSVSSDFIEKYSHERLEIVRKSPSFRRYAERQNRDDLRLLLLDDEHTRKVISKKLEEMNSYHRHFFPVIRCLTCLVSKLPGYPLGKKCRDVYEHCLKTSVKKLDLYHEAMKMATFLAKDELVPVLEECVELLDCAVKENDNTCEDLMEFIEALQSVLVDLQLLSKATPSATPSFKSTAPKVGSSITNRFQLQEKLKNAVYNRKKDTPFEKARETAISTLDKMFQRYLLCPAEQTLHEVYYYDNVEIVKQRLSGCPRVAIQTALNNPRYYMKCACCDIEPGSIQDTLPDISVVFKLHLECGRLINLYDWLQAFLTVAEPPAKTKKSNDTEEQQVLQARFIQAVSELQFLGFIKATKRKTDHVARLTWGTC